MTYIEKLEEVLKPLPKANIDRIIFMTCPKNYFGKGADKCTPDGCDNCWRQEFKEEEK